MVGSVASLLGVEYLTYGTLFGMDVFPVMVMLEFNFIYMVLCFT